MPVTAGIFLFGLISRVTGDAQSLTKLLVALSTFSIINGLTMKQIVFGENYIWKYFGFDSNTKCRTLGYIISKWPNFEEFGDRPD